MAEAGLDKWAAWLLERRDGGDEQERAKALQHLLPIRDRVLDNALLRPSDTLLDVGGGDGLIAFGALRRLGDEGAVILSDVSLDLLTRASALAEQLDEGRRMSFVLANAEDLEPIVDASVDVVTTRSVMIYVADKRSAFGSFHRVLRPGGRISIFEPINNYFPWDPTDFWGYDATPVSDLVERIWEYEGWGPEKDASDPKMNFTDKDLVRWAEEAGFAEIHAELRVDVEPKSWVAGWQVLMATSPNPNASTVGEAIRGALAPEEGARFESHLRPLVEEGQWLERSAIAHLWAVKGESPITGLPPAG